MRWISNGDPPLYVWYGDSWYNQKDKEIYFSDIDLLLWYPLLNGPEDIPFTKKTKLMPEAYEQVIRDIKSRRK